MAPKTGQQSGAAIGGAGSSRKKIQAYFGVSPMAVRSPPGLNLAPPHLANPGALLKPSPAHRSTLSLSWPQCHGGSPAAPVRGVEPPSVSTQRNRTQTDGPAQPLTYLSIQSSGAAEDREAVYATRARAARLSAAEERNPLFCFLRGENAFFYGGPPS